MYNDESLHNEIAPNPACTVYKFPQSPESSWVKETPTAHDDIELPKKS